MKKSQIRTTAVLVLVLIVLLSLCACGSGRLKGSWSSDHIHSGYPDDMVIKSGGTATVDGAEMDWDTNGNTLHFSMGPGYNWYYEYSFSGNELLLDGFTYHKLS